MSKAMLESRFGLRSLALILASISTVGLPGNAWAQDSENGDNAAQAGDIVVTAQRRAERVQDVPGSVVAISGDQLRISGASTYTDYLNSVPGVSYSKNGNFKDKVFVRGLSDSLGSRVASTTGIYIDEIPITEVDASLADLGTYDLSRVEVLRGPQGTLFGSGSMGGAIRIITNKPDLQAASASIDVLGSATRRGDGNYEANAALNLPLVADRLGIRLVSGYRHDAGFIDNTVDGQRDINDADSFYFRSYLAWKPVDRLNVLLAFYYNDSKSHYGPNQDVGLGQLNTVRYFPERNSFKTRIYNATLNYDLGGAALTSVTSYIDKSNFTVRDQTLNYRTRYIAATGVSATGLGIGLNYYYPNRSFTQELRLASTGSGRLHWLAGAYFNNFTPNNLQVVKSNNPGTANFNFYTSIVEPHRREIAEFAEASFEVVPNFILTAGVRHSDFKITSDGYTNGSLNGGTTLNGPYRANQSSTVGKFRAEYKIDRDHLLYAQASQGYRPGAPISSVSPACLPQLQSMGYTTAPTEYKPDSLWNYEVGTKNQFLDRRLTVNLDGYYIKWRDAQISQNLTCGSSIVTNAGGATSRGIELEVSAQPLPGLSFSTGASYTLSTFDRTDTTIRTVKGATLPNVPKWQVSGSGDYVSRLGGDVQGYIHADIQYVDSRASDLPLVTTNVVEPNYTIVNMRIGIKWRASDISLFVKNLTDEIAILNTVNSAQQYYQSINQPRTIGLELRQSF